MKERPTPKKPELSHEHQIDTGRPQTKGTTPRFSLIPRSEAIELLARGRRLPRSSSGSSPPPSTGDVEPGADTITSADQQERRREQLRQAQQRWRLTHPDQHEQNLAKLREKTSPPERARELAAARARRYRARKRPERLTE